MQFFINVISPKDKIFMHELSLVQGIVEAVEKEAQKENATSVTSITLQVGKFSGIEIESITFCFPIVAEKTILENAKLIIKDSPLVILCNKCNTQFSPQRVMLECPKCKSIEVTIKSGKEFKILDMEILK